MTAAASLRNGGVVRTIWSLAGDRRRTLAASLGWKSLQGLCNAIPVGVLVALIDRLRNDDLSTRDIGWSVAIVAACVVGQWVFGYLANRSAWIATFELFGAVRVRALDHLRRLPMGFHTSRRAGDSVTALTQDITAVETFTHEPLQVLVGALVSPFVVLVVLLVQDVRMGLVTMATVAVAMPVFVVTNRIFRTLAGRRQKLQAVAASRMLEYVDGLAVIRAFRLAGPRLASFRDAMDRYRAVNTELAVRLAPLGIGTMGVIMLGIPLVLFVGGWWLTGGTIDAGVFVVFAVLSLRVYQPLLAAAEGVESLRIADASLDRIAAVLDEPAQPVPLVPVATPASFEVEFNHVEFAYADAPVLRDVSFTVAPGSMLAVVGPSGAGKSTILHLIARFWDAGGGAVRIGGVDVRELTAEQLYDAVTVVFQDVYLFPGTIRDNIAFGRADAADADVEAAARAANAHEFIAALPQGYDTPVSEGGSTLSGGERQRISIARAILKDSPIVLLDEATAAVDPTSERMIQDALAALTRDKTLIVVAHRLATTRSARRDRLPRRRPDRRARRPRPPAGGRRPLRPPVAPARPRLLLARRPQRSRPLINRPVVWLMRRRAISWMH